MPALTTSLPQNQRAVPGRRRAGRFQTGPFKQAGNFCGEGGAFRSSSGGSAHCRHGAGRPAQAGWRPGPSRPARLPGAPELDQCLWLPSPIFCSVSASPPGASVRRAISAAQAAPASTKHNDQAGHRPRQHSGRRQETSSTRSPRPAPGAGHAGGWPRPADLMVKQADLGHIRQQSPEQAAHRAGSQDRDASTVSPVRASRLALPCVGFRSMWFLSSTSTHIVGAQFGSGFVTWP